MFDYSRLAQTARKLLTQFGRDVTIARAGTPVYNASTGAVSASSVLFTVKACDFAMKGDEFGDSSMVQAGDRYAIVDPDTEILLNDIYNGEYTIIRIATLAPAGVSLIQKLHLRK